MAKATKSPIAPPPASRREAIIVAFMGLAAEKELGEVSLAEIAGRAGITLGDLRAEFGSRFDILAAFIQNVDRQVLDGIDPDLEKEDVKERLFDMLMRRLDILTPHREAVRRIARSAGRDPGLALALNRLAVRSQRWMLAAAGIEAPGAGGTIRAQGLALAFARVVRVWLDDDDPALARTMRALDEQLARAGRAAGALRAFEQLTAPLRALACAPAALCGRDGGRGRRGDRSQDRQEEGWRGDDFRDPRVTPV